MSPDTLQRNAQQHAVAQQQRDYDMLSLADLLKKAGHRQPKHGAKWICADCPSGKPPAMKVEREVFYCHRCQRGGNIITLRRELGLKTIRPRLTEKERLLKRRARLLASLVQEWQKSQRRWLIVQFRNAMDREITARDRGYALLDAGLDVDTATIDEAFTAAYERDWYEDWLDGFDRLSADELVAEYLHFKRSLEDVF